MKIKHGLIRVGNGVNRDVSDIYTTRHPFNEKTEYRTTIICVDGKEISLTLTSEFAVAFAKEIINKYEFYKDKI